MSEQKTQLAVVGGGPGGYTAAFLAADLGLQVTLIESDPVPGGVCLNRGCIPSKSLLHVARTLRDARQLRDYGVQFGAPQIDLATLRNKTTKTIADLRGGLATLIARRGIHTIRGRARFADSHTLSIDPTGNPIVASDLSMDSPTGVVSANSSDDPPMELRFDHVILATGSTIRPAPFPIPPELRDAVWDSTSALELREIPNRLLVVGAGFVGLELAAAYAALGSQVTLVETLSEILPNADTELVRLFERLYLSYTGAKLRRETEVVAIRRNSDDRIPNESHGIPNETGDGIDGNIDHNIDDGLRGGDRWVRGVAVELRDATGNITTELYDRILVATGRDPATSDLGLERTRVLRNRRGFIEVDTQQRTSEAAIFAVGDCTAGPLLAHRAMHEAKIAVSVLAGGKDEVFEPLSIPNVVYADPEFAWTGETERSATAIGRTVEVAAFPWSANGRSHAEGEPVGVTKWIFDPKSQRVTGCGIVGCGASELIGEAALAIEKGASVHDLAELVHAHPTRSETLSCAAELQLGTATEVYRPRRR